LIGGCTVGVSLVAADDAAGSVIVAIHRAYSGCGKRQTRKNCPGMRQSSRPAGKLGNGIKIAAFASLLSIFHKCHCPLH